MGCGQHTGRCFLLTVCVLQIVSSEAWPGSARTRMLSEAEFLPKVVAVAASRAPQTERGGAARGGAGCSGEWVGGAGCSGEWVGEAAYPWRAGCSLVTFGAEP